MTNGGPRPPRPTGRRARVFVDRGWSPALKDKPRAVVKPSFNDWKIPAPSLELRPSGLHNATGTEWWSADLDVPSDAYELEFVLNDGGQAWDNNNKVRGADSSIGWP